MPRRIAHTVSKGMAARRTRRTSTARTATTTNSPSFRAELLAEIEQQVRTLGLSEDDVAEVVERLKQTSTPVLRDIYRKQSVEMARRIAAAGVARIQAGGRS